MRIKKKIESPGLFWLPTEPEQKKPGTLSIADGGVIELKVRGTLRPSRRRKLGKEERIVGKIEWEGDVILDDCHCTEWKSSHGVEESLFRVNMAFTGIETKPSSCDSLTFTVEGIDEWVGVSGINGNTEVAEDIKTISYQKPGDITISLENGMCLSIVFNCTSPFDYLTFSENDNLDAEEYFITEATISQKSHFKLVSQEACRLVDLISVAEKIKSLMCVGIGHIVSFDTVRAISDNRHANLYFRSEPHTKDEPFIDWSLMVFRWKEMGTDVEKVINTWIRDYEKFSPAMNLFFLAQTGSHVNAESKFVSLIQGIEAFHRRSSDEKQMHENEFKDLVDSLIKACPDDKQSWLKDRLNYGNELSLRQRMNRIIQPYRQIIGSKRARKDLIDVIVNTRNYLTHYDSDLESKTAEGEDLEDLCHRIELLFQLELLQLIGFGTEQSIIMAVDGMPFDWRDNCIRSYPQCLDT